MKSKEQLKGKRVLVVGAGNSAVDILDDAAHDGVRAVHSMRRSYYFFPKLVLGKPTDAFIDQTSRWPLPRSVMRYLYWWGLRIIVGSHWQYDLPAPDHKLFEAHPTACTLYLDHIVHGRIVTKPGIERLDGKTRAFRRWQRARRSTSSSTPPASGQASRSWTRATFWMRTAAPSSSSTPSTASIDDLFVAGLFEPAEGGVWQLADYQAKLIASFIVAMASDPEARRMVPQAEGDAPRRISAMASPTRTRPGTNSRSITIASANIWRGCSGSSARVPRCPSPGRTLAPAQADGKAQLKLAS